MGKNQFILVLFVVFIGGVFSAMPLGNITALKTFHH